MSVENGVNVCIKHSHKYIIHHSLHKFNKFMGGIMKKFLISMLMLFTTNLLFADWYYGEVKIKGRPLIHQLAKDKYKKELL